MESVAALPWNTQGYIPMGKVSSFLFFYFFFTSVYIMDISILIEFEVFLNVAHSNIRYVLNAPPTPGHLPPYNTGERYKKTNKKIIGSVIFTLIKATRAAIDPIPMTPDVCQIVLSKF